MSAIRSLLSRSIRVPVVRLALAILIVLFLLLPTVLAQEDVDPKVVGGQLASPGEWPWQVALIYAGGTPYNDQYCGGSLIDAGWVLTAAHCVDGSSPSSIQVLAGIHNLASPEAGYQRLNVSAIYVHPQYAVATTHDNDAALLRLAAPAVLGATSGGEMVATVPLVAANAGGLAGQSAAVTGWGHTGTTYATRLMEATIPVVTNTDCNDSNSYNGSITGNMICAGYAAGGVDTCQGDSGGPLVVFGPSWQLAGITSWGIGCAQPNLYGVYTRVSAVRGWIDSTMVAGPTDPHEPNNTRGTATRIFYGTVLTDPLIDPAGDADVYRFVGEAGQTVVIDIDANALGSPLDSYVELLASNGAVLAANDDHDGVDSYLTYTLAAPGNYYVKVREYNHPVEGGPGYFYTLKLDEGAAPSHMEVFVTTAGVGTTTDGLTFEKRDILHWNAFYGYWSLYLDGSAIGLPAKADIVAFDMPHGDFPAANMAFAANVVIPGVGTIAAHDLLLYDATGYHQRFDGSDVGLTTASEKIDAVDIMPGEMSPIGTNCSRYVIFSTKGAGSVKDVNNVNLSFAGEDVLGFCAAQLGPNTSGKWHKLIDGSNEGLPANATFSLSTSENGRQVYLTTAGPFNADGVSGDHSMIYVYDLDTLSFSGPIWSAADVGLPVKVDGLEAYPAP